MKIQKCNIHYCDKATLQPSQLGSTPKKKKNGRGDERRGVEKKKKKKKKKKNDK